MPKLSYLEFLIQTASSTISGLSEGIDTALRIQDRRIAITFLEGRIESAAVMASHKVNVNPEKVQTREEALGESVPE